MSRLSRMGRVSAESIERSASRLSGALQIWNSAAFAPGTPVTIQNQIPALAPFRGVRIYQKNPTAVAATLHDSRVASPAADGSDGSALVWTQATYSGAAPVALPAATGVEPNATYSVVRSAYISVVSANDSAPLLMVRSRFEASGCAMNPPAGYLAAFNAASGLPPFKTGFSLGAGVVADTTGIVMSEGQLICPAGVEFYYDRPAVTVMFGGGSTLWGQGSEGYANGLVVRACRALTNSRRVVSPFNAAFPGQNSNTTHLSAVPALLDTVRPAVVVLLPGSGNDSDLSAAGFGAMRGRFAAACESAWRAGAEVVACTLAPSSALTVGQEALRVAQNDWLLSLSDRIHVADIARAVADPADPSRLRPLYDSGDGTHFSPAGHDAGSLVTQPVLGRAIGI